MDDPVEPDSIDDGLEIWPLEYFPGALCSGSDETDWFWFEQPEPGWAEPGVRFEWQNMEVEILVYDQDGMTVLDRASWSGGGRAEVIPDIDEAGIYFVELRLLSSHPAGRGFSYTAEIAINQG